MLALLTFRKHLKHKRQHSVLLITGIWKGRVIDTLRNVYTKADFRVKRNSKLYPRLRCVSLILYQTISVHLLWVDDLILFSNTPNGLQRQLNGLYTFCANNHMIVN